MLRNERKRRGSVLPMLALAIVGLMGMLALAIDIGAVAISRGQAQNAADSAAMAGCRTINGFSSSSYNIANAPINAVKSATSNNILGTTIVGDSTNIANPSTDTYTSGNITIVVGAYAYTYNDSNPSAEGFNVQVPRTDTSEPYSAVQATVTGTNNYAFARVFGLTTFTTSATAIAVHRPRDVMIIMDLSGSMRFQSLAGIPMSGTNANPSTGSTARTKSMNPETVYPQFGHYSDTSGASLMGNTSYSTSAGEYVDPANISTSTNGGDPICADFYCNPVGTTLTTANAPSYQAFSRAPDSYATTPGGDNYLKTVLNTGGTYAHTVYEMNNSSAVTIPKFEVSGYKNYSGSWNGYTQGPGYWGKTFFVWPPSPGFKTPGSWSAPSSLTDTAYKWCTWNDSYPNDWRQRFFVAVNTSASNAPGVIQHNSILFNSTSPIMKTPGTTTNVTEGGTTVTYTFRINYAAILYWLAKQDPKPFPSTMQAGRIRYWSTMPDGTDNGLNKRWWTTVTSSLPADERIWKEYIDFVLGYTPSTSTANSYSNTQGGVSIAALVGNGDYYTYSGSTVSISNHVDRLPASPSRNPTSPYQSGVTGPYETSTTAPYQTTSTAPYQSTTTSAAASKGATTVAVNSLGSSTNANADYIGFSNSTATLYKVTNSSKTSLTLSSGLSAAISLGTSVQVYYSNGASGATLMSVTAFGSSPVANSDYVGFNGSTGNLYKLTTTSTTKLSLGSSLSSAVTVKGVSVENYDSNGTASSTKMSVSSLSITPTQNSDYVTFGNPSNPSSTQIYKVTSNSAVHLTLGTGLASAVNVNGASLQAYVSNGAIGATTLSVNNLSSSPVANSDYVIFNGDTANPYLITTVASKGTGYTLTVSPALAAAVNINGASVDIYSPYMNYSDDIKRPRHQFWFGPMSWVDWLGNYNLDTGNGGGPHHLWPGNVHEAHAWACKAGISAAIDDIENNHPSDFVGMTFFSNPMTSTGSLGHHNSAVVPLGRNYQQLKDSLWFPPTTVTGGVTEIGPYDTDMWRVPRADGGTAPGMGFMIAYNQFSSSTSNLRFYSSPSSTYRGNAGGLGRKGANRLIIFETDGVPNTAALANINSSGSDSFYPIRIKDPTNYANATNVEWPTSPGYSNTDVYSVVQQIVALDSASPPGYSSNRKKALVYSIGYGSDYDPSHAGTNQTNGLTFLQTVQYYGNTSTDTNPANFPTLQQIYGTPTQRINSMQAAFTSIMQAGVQVSLIQ